MKCKLCVFVVFVILLSITNLCWQNWIQPDLTTDVALLQFESNPGPAIMMRTLSSNQWQISVAIFIVGSSIILWPNQECKNRIRNLFHLVKGEDS